MLRNLTSMVLRGEVQSMHLMFTYYAFWMQAKYADGLALETVFVHPSLISQLDAAAEEAIGGNTW